MTKPRERSLYEQRELSTEGMLGLAAANLAGRVMALLASTRDQKGMTSRRLASALGITEGRVSQVMNGDGNVHIATLAKFMRAMGYLVELRVVPAGQADRKSVV